MLRYDDEEPEWCNSCRGIRSSSCGGGCVNNVFITNGNAGPHIWTLCAFRDTRTVLAGLYSMHAYDHHAHGSVELSHNRGARARNMKQMKTLICILHIYTKYIR